MPVALLEMLAPEAQSFINRRLQRGAILLLIQSAQSLPFVYNLAFALQFTSGLDFAMYGFNNFAYG